MTKTVYNDVSGAFTNGVTPLSQANLEPIRDFLIASGAMWDSNISVDGSGYQTLIGQKINAAGSVLNGATSGTATLYQPQRGTWKYVFVVLNNFRNSGGSAQTIAIPVPFTSTLSVRTQAMFQIQLLVSGTAQNIDIITSLAAAGGTVTTQTNIAAYSSGRCVAAVDTISFSSGGSSGQNGIIILEGV